MFAIHVVEGDFGGIFIESDQSPRDFDDQAVERKCLAIALHNTGKVCIGDDVVAAS